MSYLSMMDLNLPQNLITFLKYMEKVHSFGAAIPNPINYLSSFALKMKNHRYYDRGFVTNYSLYLCGSDIEMILVQLLAAFIVGKLALKIKLVQKIENTVKYNTPLKTLIVAYVRIALALIINLFIIGDQKLKGSIFIFVSSLILIVIIVYPFMVAIFLSSKFNRIKSNDPTILAYNTLLPVKCNICSILFYPIFLIKRLIFCIILVGLDGSNVWQIILFVALSLLYIVYLKKVEPLKDPVSQRGFIIAELGFVACILSIGFAGLGRLNINGRAIAGWVAMGCAIAMIVACWINYFVDLIPSLVQTIKTKCKNRKKNILKKRRKISMNSTS